MIANMEHQPTLAFRFPAAEIQRCGVLELVPQQRMTSALEIPGTTVAMPHLRPTSEVACLAGY